MFNSYSLHGLCKYFISLFETLNSFFTNCFEPWQTIGLGYALELSSSQTVLYHSKVLSHKQKPNSRARALCLLLVTMILVCSYRRPTAPLLPLSHLPKSSCSYLSSHSPSPTYPDSDSLSSPTRLSLSLSDGEDQLDRLQKVELARGIPMSLWRAGTVQAWLEVVMAMPMYIRACSENVKSGKV